MRQWNERARAHKGVAKVWCGGGLSVMPSRDISKEVPGKACKLSQGKRRLQDLQTYIMVAC